MSTERFDHLLRSVLSNHTAMVGHYNAVKRSIPLFRRSAYRFAADLLAIRKNWPNEFLDYVTTHGIDIDSWMDEHFDPVEQMGEERKNLFRCIENGMTEQEYVRQFTLWGVKKRAAVRLRTAHVDRQAVEVPTDGMTDAEQIDYFKKQCKALADENVQLQRHLATALRELEQMKTDFARAERLFASRKRKTA